MHRALQHGRDRGLTKFKTRRNLSKLVRFKSLWPVQALNLTRRWAFALRLLQLRRWLDLLPCSTVVGYVYEWIYGGQYKTPRTADYGLRTEYKIRTMKYGLVKCMVNKGTSSSSSSWGLPKITGGKKDKNRLKVIDHSLPFQCLTSVAQTL